MNMAYNITQQQLAGWALSPRPKATAVDIARLESELGFSMPAPYVEFVTRYGFVLFDQDQPARNRFAAHYTGSGQVEVREGDITYLLQPERIIQSYRSSTAPEFDDDTTLPAFPDTYVPIAGDSGQGKVLLEMAPRHGRVWYWREKEWRWGTEDNTELGFVAENFYDFINNLQSDPL